MGNDNCTSSLAGLANGVVHDCNNKEFPRVRISQRQNLCFGVASSKFLVHEPIFEKYFPNLQGLECGLDGLVGELVTWLILFVFVVMLHWGLFSLLGGCWVAFAIGVGIKRPLKKILSKQKILHNYDKWENYFGTRESRKMHSEMKWALIVPPPPPTINGPNWHPGIHNKTVW